MLLFVLLSMWWLLFFCYCHVCTQWFYLTSVECFCNVHDWSKSPENVSWGDVTLNWPDTSWHSLPRPATQCGWAQVAKQQARRMSKALTWRKVQPKWQWQTRRTRGWQGVPLCKTTPLPLSNLVTHAAAAQQSLSFHFIFLLPCSFLSLGRVPQSKHVLRELNIDRPETGFLFQLVHQHSALGFTVFFMFIELPTMTVKQ